MTKPKYQVEAEKLTAELAEAQTQLRRNQAQIQFLGEALTNRVERYHALRVAHGDTNASSGFSAMQQEVDAINGRLNAIAQAEVVG